MLYCIIVGQNYFINFHPCSLICEFLFFRAPSAPSDIQQQRRDEAAQVFRTRRHISQEDTLSLGSMEDISNAVGRVESPAQVRIQVCHDLFSFLTCS